jgi:hypothetical protein
VIACPPLFCTVKVAVVAWFTAGDAGDKVKAVTSEIVPAVWACALPGDSSVDDTAPLTSSPTTKWDLRTVIKRVMGNTLSGRKCRPRRGSIRKGYAAYVTWRIQ